MENATEALMMAFGMLMFVIAITVTMSLFNQARATSDYIIFQKDKTNFVEAEEFSNTLLANTNAGFDFSQRLVGIETIIPALFKYNKENYRVVFLKPNLEPLEVYKSPSSAVDAYKNKYGFSDRGVCSFDLTEEYLRQEPWLVNPETTAENLYTFLVGGNYTVNNKNISYSSFLDQYKDKKFIEVIDEVTEIVERKADGEITTETTKVIYYILYE